MSRDGGQHSTCCCQFGICWLRIGFYVPYLNKVQEKVSFSFHSTHKHIHFRSNLCWWNWKHHIFNAFLCHLGNARIITLALILLTCPTSKSWIHGFRCGTQGGHIPLIINPSPEMPSRSTQNCLYCLAEKSYTFCHNWTGVPKKGVRTCEMLLCQFVVSEKNGPNYSTCTHSTLHTNPLTLCADTSWFNVGSADHYLLILMVHICIGLKPVFYC